jgi:transcriptional regulator
MYIPPAFLEADKVKLHAAMRGAGLANLVTATRGGPAVTPLPLLLDESEGESGTLYGHIARANDHWKQEALGESLAIFMGPDAYITPSWYATKQETGKVVPTWNYVIVHAHGPVEFFHDPERLLAAVTRLTQRHESPLPDPWKVDDAPADYIQAQLRGIVGLRLSITRLEGKTKMSQNRAAADRAGVAAGLGASRNPVDNEAGLLVGEQRP